MMTMRIATIDSHDFDMVTVIGIMLIMVSMAMLVTMKVLLLIQMALMINYDYVQGPSGADLGPILSRSARGPTLFSLFWNAVKPWIDPNTVKKISFVNSSELLRHVHPDMFPKEVAERFGVDGAPPPVEK